MSRAGSDVAALSTRNPRGKKSGVFQGVLANAENMETCRELLQEVLEDWMLLGVKLGHEMPVVNGIRLMAAETA